MDFGMPTLVELDTLAESAALCRELGLSFVEINMNLPFCQTDALDIPSLRAEKGLYYTFHLDENLSPADFNPEIAQAYLTTTLRTIEAAREIGAPVLNMHMAEGVHFKLPDKKVYLFEKFRGEYRAALSRFRDACDKAIGSENIRICVENCDGYPPYVQEGIDLLLESPVFALTFDIGHSHCAGRQDEPFINARADRLLHMHIHDAQGDRCHLRLGEGDVDIASMLALAQKQHCRCVLETKTAEALRKSKAWLAQAGYEK